MEQKFESIIDMDFYRKFRFFEFVFVDFVGNNFYNFLNLGWIYKSRKRRRR